MAICKCYVVEIFVSGFEWSDQNQIRIRPLQKKINDWTRFFSFTWPDQNTCIRPDMDLKLYYILFSRLHFHLYPYPKHHVDSHSADNPESGLLVSHFFFLTDPDPDNKNYQIQYYYVKKLGPHPLQGYGMDSDRCPYDRDSYKRQHGWRVGDCFYHLFSQNWGVEVTRIFTFVRAFPKNKVYCMYKKS